MLVKCYNIIDQTTVNQIFKNLTLIDFEWEESYNALSTIDYSQFRFSDGLDLEYTPQQHIILTKLEKARDEYISLTKVRQSLSSQSFSILGYNINDISGGFKTFYLLAVFTAFIFGTLFLLNKLNNRKDKTKKKKKN